jgi:hypothetical protein
MGRMGQLCGCNNIQLRHNRRLYLLSAEIEDFEWINVSFCL